MRQNNERKEQKDKYKAFTFFRVAKSVFKFMEKSLATTGMPQVVGILGQTEPYKNSDKILIEEIQNLFFFFKIF